MHLTDQVLRAYMDHELTASEQNRAAEHLTVCPACRTHHAALEARAARISAHLAPLAPHPNEAPRSAQIALTKLNRLRQSSASGKEKLTMFKSILAPRLRPLWAGLAALALFVSAFSFAPVRAWAGEFLGLFRVKQIAVLPIDTTRLGELGGNSTLERQFSQLFADSMTVTHEPGKPQVIASAAEASQIAGFTVRTWSESPIPPQITVQDGAAFEFVVNRGRAQALLDESGRNDLQLPASLDGAKIEVNIPTGVSVAYGDCPNPESEAEREGTSGQRMSNCTILAEISSPTVSAPPDLDLAQFAEIGLQFTGMSQAQAQAFSQTVDWTSTLVVPIPRNAAAYEQVTVDGVTGNLIRRLSNDGDAPQYALIWVKEGIIYAIGGLGNNAEKALEIANSLQ
jgi:hypothetical protein